MKNSTTVILSTDFVKWWNSNFRIFTHSKYMYVKVVKNTKGKIFIFQKKKSRFHRSSKYENESRLWAIDFKYLGVEE